MRLRTLLLGLFVVVAGCAKGPLDVPDRHSNSKSQGINQIDTRSINSDITGWIDEQRPAELGAYRVNGWACLKGSAESISVDLYLGGAYGHGGVLISRILADQASEEAVAQVCGTTFNKYRFVFDISADIVAAYAGKSIYVHAVSRSSNSVIGNSGKLFLHSAVTPGGEIIKNPDQYLSPNPNLGIDQVTKNPYRVNDNLTIATESKFLQSEYPGCMGLPNVFPTACRERQAITGNNHVYAQRLPMEAWTPSNGFCEGTDKTTPLIYATTNDAMDPASFIFAEIGGLAMAISETPGDLNPPDVNCRAQGPKDIVAVRIKQRLDVVDRGNKICLLLPGKTYYINVKMAGFNTSSCGSSEDRVCRFGVYTYHLPSKSSNCR